MNRLKGLINFDTEKLGLFFDIGDSHITYYGHIGDYIFGETEKYYRMKCPLCWDWSCDTWDDPLDCPFCDNTERLNVVRWLWAKWRLSELCDQLSMRIHWLKTGERVW